MAGAYLMTLQDHAQFFTELMDDLIANLENDSCMVEALKEVGHKHCPLAPGGGERFRLLARFALSSFAIARREIRKATDFNRGQHL